MPARRPGRRLAVPGGVVEVYVYLSAASGDGEADEHPVLPAGAAPELPLTCRVSGAGQTSGRLPGAGAVAPGPCPRAGARNCRHGQDGGPVRQARERVQGDVLQPPPLFSRILGHHHRLAPLTPTLSPLGRGRPALTAAGTSPHGAVGGASPSPHRGEGARRADEGVRAVVMAEKSRNNFPI